MEKFFEIVGFVAAVAMPFFNIPFILRIIRRKSASDISLAWVFGVWGCILLMFPSALLSDDMVLRAFGWANTILFSFVVATVVFFKRRTQDPEL